MSDRYFWLEQDFRVSLVPTASHPFPLSRGLAAAWDSLGPVLQATTLRDPACLSTGLLRAPPLAVTPPSIAVAPWGHRQNVLVISREKVIAVRGLTGAFVLRAYPADTPAATDPAGR